MTDQSMRAAFEAWYVSFYNEPFPQEFRIIGDWACWQAATRQALERAAKVCESIADDYQQRESLKYAELKTDAQTGASDCEHAIRALEG